MYKWLHDHNYLHKLGPYLAIRTKYPHQNIWLVVATWYKQNSAVC